jgi:CheY-like chemotaxis protein
MQPWSARVFEVVAAANVSEALGLIASERFDVLVTDLHLPDPGDGFTVVTAMRHSQPQCPYPVGQRLSRRAERPGRDSFGGGEIMVKPFEVGRFADLFREKILTRVPAPHLEKEKSRRNFAAVPSRACRGVVGECETEQGAELDCAERRRSYRAPSEVGGRRGAAAELGPGLNRHGTCGQRVSLCPGPRRTSISAGLHSGDAGARVANPAGNNIRDLAEQSEPFGFQLLLPDVMAIADEVDSHLTQATESYMRVMRKSAA